MLKQRQREEKIRGTVCEIFMKNMMKSESVFSREVHCQNQLFNTLEWPFQRHVNDVIFEISVELN